MYFYVALAVLNYLTMPPYIWWLSIALDLCIGFLFKKYIYIKYILVNLFQQPYMKSCIWEFVEGSLYLTDSTPYGFCKKLWVMYRSDVFGKRVKRVYVENMGKNSGLPCAEYTSKYDFRDSLNITWSKWNLNLIFCLLLRHLFHLSFWSETKICIRKNTRKVTNERFWKQQVEPIHAKWNWYKNKNEKLCSRISLKIWTKYLKRISILELSFHWHILYSSNIFHQ